MATATFYPDAHPESTSCDGNVYRLTPAGESWANIHDSTGTNVDDSSTSAQAKIQCAGSSLWTELRRVILLFDTSALPGNAVIDSAVLSINVQTKSENISQSLVITSANPASNTGLVTADYEISKFGNIDLSSRLAVSSISTSAYNDLTLNAAGRAAINKNGITKLALRMSSDVDDSAPTTSSGQTFVTIYTAEGFGSVDPKLTIEYHESTDCFMASD